MLKTKLDVNGIEVYTIENEQECIEALNSLKADCLNNGYLHEFIPQIENAIEAMESQSFNTVLEIKRKTNCKDLNRILYIFEKDCLYAS